MTTMDSDSESQDSDDGRRFRFEATRKDSPQSENSRKRGISPSRERSSRRSRSRDRGNRDRRDDDRHRRESRSDVKASSGRHVATNNRESRDRRGSTSSSRRSTKNHKRRSHDRDEKSSTNERHDKSRDHKRHSRDRSRERSSNVDSRARIVDRSRSRDDGGRWESSRGTGRKNEEKTSREIEKVEKSSDSKKSVDSTSPSMTRQDCQDLNLSDFDIVSDTEETSSDNSGSRANDVVKTSTRLPDDESGSLTKKRVSKNRYERMLKRQAVRKRRNSEELQKVKPRNGGNENDKSDNNQRDLSDFSLGNAVFTTTGTSSTLINNVEHISTDEFNDDIDDIVSEENAKFNDNTNEINDGNLDRPRASSPTKNIDDSENTVKKIRVMGPNLPTNYPKFDDCDSEETFGPALPPHLKKNSLESRNEETIGQEISDSQNVGGNSESEDDDLTGPLPMDHPAFGNNIVQQQLEKRARRLKDELAACDNEDEKKREEWMTELPPAQSANLGLGPRKFRVRPAPDMSDRSSWTDTPADRVRKQMEKLENKGVSESTRNVEKTKNDDANCGMEKVKKRQKSLLELHQKKLNKKKKKEEKEAKKIGKPAERRPFDRDVDLQANRFDEARKKNMFLKARELDDRFSRGKI